MDITEIPEIQIFHLIGVKHIRPEKAIDLIRQKKVLIIDVREYPDFKNEYLDFDSVSSHPMSNIMDSLSEIPRDIPLIIFSSDGINSTKVANLLNRQGFPEVTNLDGGMVAWKINGFKTVKSPNQIEKSSQDCQSNTCGHSCGGCT